MYVRLAYIFRQFSIQELAVACLSFCFVIGASLLHERLPEIVRRSVCKSKYRFDCATNPKSIAKSCTESRTRL